MFLIDSLLTAPMRGLLFVFREIHEAAEQDLANAAGTIRADLAQLYLLLESGAMTEDEFDRREKELLDRLDELESPTGGAAEESAPETEE